MLVFLAALDDQRLYGRIEAEALLGLELPHGRDDGDRLLADVFSRVVNP